MKFNLSNKFKAEVKCKTFLNFKNVLHSTSALNLFDISYISHFRVKFKISWNFIIILILCVFSRCFLVDDVVEFSHSPKCQVTNIESCTARRRINHNIADIPNYSVNGRE